MSIEGTIAAAGLEKTGALESLTRGLTADQEAMATLRDRFGTGSEALNGLPARRMEMQKPLESLSQQEALDTLRDRFEGKGLQELGAGADVPTGKGTDIGTFETVNTFSMEAGSPWEKYRLAECNGQEMFTPLTSGKDSAALNSELPRSACWEVKSRVCDSSQTIWTDEFGRVVRSLIDKLQLADGVRDLGQQRLCCELKDGLPTDDAGHILAREFGGAAEQYNMLPMDSYLNRSGEWRNLERGWKRDLLDGKSVTEVQVLPQYDGISGRPVAFEVSYKVDGEVFQQRIENTPHAA